MHGHDRRAPRESYRLPTLHHVDNGVPPDKKRQSPRPRKASAKASNGDDRVIDPMMKAMSARQVEVDEPKRTRVVVEPPIADDDDAPVVYAEVREDTIDVPDAEAEVEDRVPYVLPKIVPGEPEPEPEAEDDSASTAPEPTPTPQALLAIKRFVRSLRPVTIARPRPRVRRVTRVVRQVDTWSVFRVALLFNLFLYVVLLTSAVMLWRVALNTGTIENIERFFESFGWQTFELKGGEIYHGLWIIGLFCVVGFTGLAVLAATLFNLITDLVGGIRVTVLEEEVRARVD